MIVDDEAGAISPAHPPGTALNRASQAGSHKRRALTSANPARPWAPYAEENYSNCMCLRTDMKRNHIIMFEPELVTGSKFQLMSRSHDFAYIERHVSDLFARIGDEEPFFALYINCAGRAGAYAGIEDEDAHFVQRAIGGRVPLLGFYSGIEIGPIQGEPKPMDWTGLLCLFTARKSQNRQTGEME